jgi:hypothetical protein
MKTLLATALISLIPALGWSATVSFDDMKKGEPLKGWLQGFYGAKGSPNWSIDEDATAPSRPHVLKQSGNAIYSWTVLPGPVVADGSVEADMKIISGKEDPEVGLVWRHKDGKNYFYARINGLEDNVIFYRMNNGKKEVVKEIETKVGFNKWHGLRVEFKGEQVEIFFDKKSVISVRDASFKTKGRVGLFTTADTVGAFDNVKVE